MTRTIQLTEYTPKKVSAIQQEQSVTTVTGGGDV